MVDKKLGILALLLSLSFFASQASFAAVAARKVTSVEGITEYQLQNGLRVLLFPDPSQDAITVNITYLVGSRHESYGETGMAHLLEHLLFKGSTNHRAIPKELTAHGARPNGTTSYDRTNYFETFPANTDNLKWAIDLEADRMVHSFIAKKDLVTEMPVVRNEMEKGENDPDRMLGQRIMSAAFIWHNYGKSTIGARSDVEGVSIDRLQAFYKKYYQPDNAVLVVAGRFDEPKTLDMIAKRFGKIPRPARKLEALYTEEPAQDGEREVTLRRVGDNQLIGAFYHFPSATHPDSAALTILAQMLGDSPSGRLYQALVLTKKAASVSAYGRGLHDSGIFIASAEIRKDGSLDAAKAAMIDALENFTKRPITREEFERARAKILRAYEFEFNHPTQLGISLTESISKGDWRLYFIGRDRIRKITLADVQRVANTYLRPSNRTLGVFVPTDKPERIEIAAAPALQDVLKEYKGDDAVSVGEVFDPSPANIEKRVHRSTLSGGMKLALLPKKTRGAMVQVSLALDFGNTKDLKNRIQAAEMAGSMLMKGTQARTRQQIQDELDRLKVNLTLNGSATGAWANLSTTRENLLPALKLVAEILRMPAFPPSEFDTLKEESLAAIEGQRNEPGALASLTYNRHQNPYNKGEPLYIRTIDEKLEDIRATTLSQVKDFYNDFYGASHARVAVVGDFDEKETEETLKALFDGWKSRLPYERVEARHFDVSSVNLTIPTPDKDNAVYYSGFNFEMKDSDPDYPALVLANYMIGGGFLSSRLAERIRQKEGLSYGINSSLSIGVLDPVGSFTVGAICAPFNEKKLEDAVAEEMKRAVGEKFSADEIKRAKSGYLESAQMNRSQDATLAATLATLTFFDRTFDWSARLEKKISGLTANQIQAALKKSFRPDRMTVVKAGDFTKTAKPVLTGGKPAKSR